MAWLHFDSIWPLRRPCTPQDHAGPSCVANLKQAIRLSQAKIPCKVETLSDPPRTRHHTHGLKAYAVTSADVDALSKAQNTIQRAFLGSGASDIRARWLAIQSR